MPAAEARSDVLGCCSMPIYSHDANFMSTRFIRMVRNERIGAGPYDTNMARKTSRSLPPRQPQPDWYLPEWMDTLQVKQSALAKACDWNGSTMHGIYHGRTEYYREIVNLISKQLNIEPYELLMPPDRAMAIRQFLASAETIVSIAYDGEKRDGTNG